MPSANRITLLRDADGDGVAEARSAFLTGLNSPFGMALVGDGLYVANTDALVRFPYKTGDDQDHREAARRSSSCPAAAITGRATSSPRRTASSCTSSVGSSSNIAENGLDAREAAAPTSCEVDPDDQDIRASTAPGLRNPNGMAFEPRSGRLWTVVNERDMLGSDIVARLSDLGRARRPFRLAVVLLGRLSRQARRAGATPTLQQYAQAPRLCAGAARRGARPDLRRRREARRELRATARSSACTARGTASRCRATRWSTCRSAPTASRRRARSRSTC